MPLTVRAIRRNSPRSRWSPGAQVDRLGQVPGGDRAEHAADLDGRPDELVDQVVCGGDGAGPGALAVARAQPLVQPPVPADDPPDPVQLAGQVTVALDDLVDDGGQPAMGESGAPGTRSRT